MGYDPFIKSQLTPRNQFQGLMWCERGHITLKIGENKPCTVQCVVGSDLIADARRGDSIRDQHQRSVFLLSGSRFRGSVLGSTVLGLRVKGCQRGRPDVGVSLITALRTVGC